jgi:hypothetical protein
VRLLKESAHKAPAVSLILLDWSVRESFHLLHYLRDQDVPREVFEVIVIEYYGRVSEAIKPFADEVDTWVLLQMPEGCYYHKHLMYNVGIVLSRGEICVICDSDAMVKPEFIRAIIEEFKQQPDLVLHIDQFRNIRRNLYPFNYPTFDEVIGDGCINCIDGKTTGILDEHDPIHTRNYGACMCARRTDLIAIGGADEHIDYLGHICGPYEMTFRLVNAGKHERWHPTEFMFHTWHPGQAGEDNYLGPHDGRHLSTTALEALYTFRTLPLVENEAVARLRTDPESDPAVLRDTLIAPGRIQDWRRDLVEGGRAATQPDAEHWRPIEYSGFLIDQERKERYRSRSLTSFSLQGAGWQGERAGALDDSLSQAMRRIDRFVPFGVRILASVVAALVSASQLAAHARTWLLRRVAYGR